MNRVEKPVSNFITLLDLPANECLNKVTYCYSYYYGVCVVSRIAS